MYAIAIAAAAQQAELRKRLAEARRRVARELDEIDAARMRLDGGEYGECERCHHPIPLARLRAMPATRHCAGCEHWPPADA